MAAAIKYEVHSSGNGGRQFLVLAGSPDAAVSTVCEQTKLGIGSIIKRLNKIDLKTPLRVEKITAEQQPAKPDGDGNLPFLVSLHLIPA